ncbi:MAG: transposase [Nitratireductor sp.]
MAGSSQDVDALNLAELRQLIAALMEENARLRAENAALREDIARLKGLPAKPKLKPSGMAKQTERAEVKRRRKQKHRGAKKLREKVTETRVVEAAVPAGARFKGYRDFYVQELSIARRVIRVRRARWQLPDGRLVVAPLPAGLRGHFGPELRRFVLAQYHQGQTTVERLLALLRDLGIEISKRQLVRLLTAGIEGFAAEADAVLAAGLATAPWITVDDTGARHAGANQTCTQIGNDRFAWFATRPSKSRLNFLELLQAGPPAWRINEAALDYMRERRLSPGRIAALRRGGEIAFDDRQAWCAYAAGLGIRATGGPLDPLRLATEGAAWGALAARGLLQDTVIVSDAAGQFDVATHARCWVHAERLIHTLDTFNDRKRAAKERIRRRLWRLYADLRAWQRNPRPERARALADRFDALFTSRTGFVTLDRLLARLHADRDDLLRVLDHPGIPLHTNGSENDIRACVTRRRLSGGTHSDNGRQARDAMLSLMKTCRKLGISFWQYLGHRLGVDAAQPVPPLADIVRQPAPA